MTVTALVGLQWGDEGKGKVVDYLASRMDVVARGAGGANAGHTIVLDSGEKHVFHLLPSGILRPTVVSVLGAGMVVDPWQLAEEIRTAGIEPSQGGRRLVISSRAQLVLPYAKLLEAGLERLMSIGTTRRGIGPAYAMRALRIGVPISYLSHPEHLRRNLEVMHAIISTFGSEMAPWPSEIIDSLEEVKESVMPFVGDATAFVQDARARGQEILLEGAQGVMLDLVHGTYPYVTSSSTTAVGLAQGVGLGMGAVDTVIGVVKAYTTRVGDGPFPTEEHGEMGRTLCERGHEFGATTGRARRCGWLDLVALRWAVRVSGVDALVLTKLDVLDGLSEVPVCVAYDIEDHGVTEDMPEDPVLLEHARPVYERVPGWSSAEGLGERGVRSYVEMVERAVGVPVRMVSWGPRRSQTLELE